MLYRCYLSVKASDFSFNLIQGAVESLSLTAENAKDCAKHTKIKHWFYNLCELCVEPLRPLRLMDFDFFNTTTTRGCIV